jgi:heat shock protein HtpX
MKSRARTFLLMVVLTVIFVWVGGELGGRQGAITAFIVAGLINFIGYWFSDKLVLKRYRAQEVGPEENSRLYNIVSPLSQNAGLPPPRVYLIPEQNPNAFATGRNPKHAAVAATQGIMHLLNDDELSGVMAHELAHVKNRDTLTSTIAATFAGAIAMLSQVARYQPRDNRRRQNPIVTILILVGAPLAAVLIRMLISRIREYAADAGGAQISGRPLSLADALKKIHQGMRRNPLSMGSPVHSHLFIVNPFFGGLQKLFSTHPPVEERIRRLEAMAADRQPASV